MHSFKRAKGALNNWTQLSHYLWPCLSAVRHTDATNDTTGAACEGWAHHCLTQCAWGEGKGGEGRGGGLLKASVSECLPLAAPIGLSPLLILTLCGPERVLVVSTEPLDDFSCLTTPVGCPRDGLLPVPLTRCLQMHTPSPSWVCRLQH